MTVSDLDHSEVAEGEEARQWHQWLWLSVLGVGILLILLSNLVASGGGWKTAIVLALLMLGHGGIAHRNRHVSHDTKGDGFYYLGLLFTFASLVSALIAFPRSGRIAGDGDPVETMLPLIGNFGIALTTTIVGLAGRVFFTMRHDTADDGTGNATDQLKSVINEITDNLVAAGCNMEDLVGHLKESASALAKTTGEIASSVKKADSNAAILTGYSSQVVEMANAFSESVESGSGSVAKLKRRMKATVKSLDHFGTALDGSTQKLGEVKAAVAKTKAVFVDAQERAKRELATATDEVSALGNQADRAREELRKMAIVFADGAKAATGSLDAVQSAARRAAALEAGLDRTDKAVSSFASSVVDAGARIAEATASFREVGGHAAAASKGLEGMKDAAAEALSDLASVSEVARGMQGQLTGPGSEATEQMSAAATETGRVASELNRLTDQLSDTERGLSDITRQSAEVVKNLAEHTGTRSRLGVIGRIFGRIFGRHQ